MNGFDLSTVTNIYLGSTPVKEVYMGSTRIWPTEADEYATEYFTIESLEDNNQIGIVDSDRPSIEISTNKYEWTTVTPDAAPTYFIELNAGEKVYIKAGNNEAYYSDSWSTEGYFTSTGRFNVSGNITSLLCGYASSDILSSIDMPSEVFKKLFYNAYNLISAEHLVLPYTTSYGCYENMFAYCSSLTKAPTILPATGFSYDNCYKGMFQSCSSLTKAPKLPATNLTQGCYENMFAYCSSLTTAPSLPATNISYNCYSGMFKGCSSLTKAPELPATKLYNECYFSMFYGCSSLTKAPKLPATSLATYCYGGMFMGCSSLTTAPELPATTLATWCYANMFYGCKSLTKAPELPATTLPSNCYTFMFQDCSSLNYIKILATSISSSNCMQGWVANVAPSGTFIKDASTTLPTGSNGIPDGWTVENVYDYYKYYFTFVALEDGTFTFTQNDMEYSLDNGTTWNTLAANTASPTVTSGNNIMWKQTNLPTNSNNGIGTFTSTGKFNVHGNIMSLLYANNFQNKTTLQSSYIFRKLFANANKLVSAEHLVLPATTLTTRCYNEMFSGCSSLTTAPKLPATTLANNCYDCMLYGCSSLTTAPELPATTLSNSCYFYMFSGCSSLNTAPKLPATVLAEYCYEGIFENCTSLTTAPELPATTLADYCYANMFIGCTSLTTAPELPATTLANGCYVGMFQGCTGLTSAPILPATTLAQSCYANMFKNCSSLNYIKMLATDVSASSCLYWWVNGVATSGTFVKDASTTLPTGISGIPDGWEVITA